ncbi:MAG: serine/threonine protein kinase, partial [Deltaproteobacteria bacterium]|nr:serine/threonine protein kinase [Deltaproteobacteria bacterium]
MDLTGQRIADRYDVIRLLGEGGMGQVYEARHVALDKQVAIKFLFMELAEDEELLARFRREARITAALRHANIVEVMDFGVTDEGLPWLVMEYLAGESLQEILEREERLSIPAARKIMAQMLSGLAEAHAQSIIHRDLKPDNVYLDEIKGQGTVVKLLDFGISKITDRDEKENLQLTKTGVVMGTPNYMSPEHVMGSADLDVRADIYACGTILFEMLTGRRPFEGETHNEVVVRIMGDPIPDMTSLRSDIPQTLVDIVLKALAREREGRFSTAEEFSEALEVFDPDQPSVSLTSLRIPAVPGAPRRKPSWILPAIIGAAVLLSLVVIVAMVSIISSFTGGKKDELITVTPRGAPEAAVILLDGSEMAGDEPFAIARGDEPVLFTVRAPGYVSSEFE